MSPTPEQAERFARDVSDLLPDLLAGAVRMAKNRADAEDLVADAIAKAWAHLDSLREPASFRGWVFRILTNEYVSRCRARAARGPHASLDEPSGAPGEESFSLFERLHPPFLLWRGNPEQEFLNKLLREDIERAVDALPECFRLAIVLADIEGFSYREIAETLHIPVGTVRSRIARGRALLQKALWTHAADEGLKPPYTERQTAHP